MAKPRTAKLKVFRTAIGFHDAYVAAPSQKGALEAWGSDSNLFSAGAAEQVTETELMKVPLSRPGEVIKVLRGTKAEQVAALGKMMVGGGKKAGSPVKPGMTKKKKELKPSRAAVDAAEEALERVQRDQAKAMAAIDDELAEIERRRRELARKHKRERVEAEEKAEREQERYERELEAWKKDN